MDDGACLRVFGSTTGEAGVEPERCAQPIGVALNQVCAAKTISDVTHSHGSEETDEQTVFNHHS
jgi:hypothetical protein